jgi:hypothetical protein
LHKLEKVGLDKPNKLKLQHHNHRHQHPNCKHQLKDVVCLLVKAVLLVEVEEEAEAEVLHNLLEEEQTPLNSNKLQQLRHLPIVH